VGQVAEREQARAERAQLLLGGGAVVEVHRGAPHYSFATAAAQVQDVLVAGSSSKELGHH